MSHSNAKKAVGISAVRGEIAKQAAVILILIAIATWQHHFVMQAATADIYIFLLLVGVALFGIYNAIKGTYSLGNDFSALAAMKEVHQDALRKKNAPEDHVQIVDQRLTARQTVYKAPSALGTAHNLIVEEILRSGSLRIPTSTMQVLVQDLETKLDERQAMSHYLGPLMVLLGLLGTFIGLMHVLESVGGILASLDLSGSAGAGTIAKLIESLKRPLEGMATGFGASLLGLIGSLIIGVLAKFDVKAAQRLQHDFETWIRSAVQIEASGSADIASRESARKGGAVDPQAAGNWRAMFQVARLTVQSNSRMSEQVSGLSETLQELAEKLDAQNAMNEKWFARMTWAVQKDASTQTGIKTSVENLNGMLSETRQKIGTQMMELTDAVTASSQKTDAFSTQVSEDLRKIGDAMLWYKEGLSDADRRLEAAENRLARFRNSADETAAAATRDEAAELVANLDHLIAATRLNKDDVDRLRKMSSLMGEMSGAKNDDDNNPMAVVEASLKEASR